MAGIKRRHRAPSTQIVLLLEIIGLLSLNAVLENVNMKNNSIPIIDIISCNHKTDHLKRKCIEAVSNQNAPLIFCLVTCLFLFHLLLFLY